MRIQETVRKPMTEAKYLNVDNTDRYRPIIRLFYLKYHYRIDGYLLHMFFYRNE